MLTLDVLELTHPTYSLITLGLFPADLMIVGEFNNDFTGEIHHRN
jgi:hypothetical protein